MTAKDLAKRFPEMTILADHPSRDDEVSPDMFHLESRLSVAFDVLRHRQTQCPITIAVYGDWGTGKTSAMRWLESRLNEWNCPSNEENRLNHPRVYPVWFDPWKYHSREDVWRGIIAEVILALFQVKRLDRENFARRIREASKKFGAFLGKSFLHALARTEISMKADSIVAGAEVSISGEIFSEIYEEYNKTNQPEKAYLNQFEDSLRHWIHGFLEPRQERIAIFIDDLDRCLPEVTLEVLEAIKLYLNIDTLIFVVGLDRDAVDHVVAAHYNSKGIAPEKSRQYLDKIFQVEIHVSPSQEQMADFLDSQIKHLGKATVGYWDMMLPENDPDQYREKLEDGIRALSRFNPREIKRLLNSALIRGRAAVDHPSLSDSPGSTSKLRFAQGVQVFLVQRYFRSFLPYAERWLLNSEFLLWLEEVSLFLCEHPGFSVPVTLLTDQSGGEEKKAINQKTSTNAGIFSEIRDRCPLLEGRKIDFLIFQDEVLLNILRVPFSCEVAQLAPKGDLGEKTRASNSAASLLPEFLIKLAARDLAKPFDLITKEDLNRVKELDLSNSEAIDNDLKFLKSFVKLTKLNLSRTKITNFGIQALNAIPNLHSLNLSGTRISDEGVSKISMPSLTSINLSSTEITDAALDRLDTLRLFEVFLSHTRITKAAIGKLSNFRYLDLLDVIETDAICGIAPDIINLQNLRKLYIGGENITDETMTTVAKLRNLEILFVINAPVTDQIATHIKTLNLLNSLTISNTLIHYCPKQE